MNNLRGVATSLHSEKYRPDIDGLRAIAVLLVVFCHAFPKALPGGFIGVDIFFVISGYLISKIIMRDLANNRFSIWHFYERRIRRIFPALLVVMMAVLLFGELCMFEPEFLALGRHTLASSVFVENFLLWSEVSYFDPESTLKPTLHLWSLSIEEQFYVLWPLLLYIFCRKYAWFPAIFGALFITFFLVNLYDIYSDPTAAYYSPIGRSWELMIGAGLAFIHRHYPNLLAQHRDTQSFVGLALIMSAVILVRPESDFPGFWALLPTSGAFLLLGCGSDAWVNRQLLSLSPMIWFGMISYPLYLWHWPLLSFAYILIGHLTIVVAGTCVALSIVLAAFTFQFIELPIRRWRSVALPLATTMVLLAVASGLMIAGVWQSRLSHFRAPTQNEWSFIDSSFTTSPNQSGIYPLGQRRSRNVLFIGDSHTAQYAERLSVLVNASKGAPGVIMAVGGGCIPIKATRTDLVARRDCWAMRDKGWQLAKDPRFERVVIGGAWNRYLLGEDYYIRVANRKIALGNPEGQQLALDALARSVGDLRRLGKDVVIILDNPRDEHLSSRNWRIRLNFRLKSFEGGQTTNVSEAQLALHDRMVSWASEHHVAVIDPYKAICSGTKCRITDASGLPIFKDNNHFNPAWTINNAHFIDATLR